MYKLKIKKMSVIIFAVFQILCFTACNGNSGIRVLNKGIGTPTEQVTTSQKAEPNEKYEALNFDEQKAIWISYIELADFLSGGDEKSFEQSFSNAVKNVKDSGFNTVYVHVRAFSDAYYKSDYYPKASVLSGTDFDPLQIMITCAHEQNISFHAWINPFRCMNESNMDSMDSSYKIKQWYDAGSGQVKSVSGNDNYWLDPSYDEVFELINNGVKEIIENYDVDGIHFDDYFFPTADESFDAAEFKASGEESLSDYRLGRINNMVKGVYDTVKSANSSVLFGLSPQGNINNDYESQFADVKRWCSEEGFCDYIAPQVYYGYESTCPYAETISQWDEMCGDHIKLVIGLGEYKIVSEEEFISTKGIIANMINDAKKLQKYSGFAVYNYKNLFEPDDENSQRVMAEKELIEEAIK